MSSTVISPLVTVSLTSISWPLKYRILVLDGLCFRVIIVAMNTAMLSHRCRFLFDGWPGKLYCRFVMRSLSSSDNVFANDNNFYDCWTCAQSLNCRCFAFCSFWGAHTADSEAKASFSQMGHGLWVTPQVDHLRSCYRLLELCVYSNIYIYGWNRLSL